MKINRNIPLFYLFFSNCFYQPKKAQTIKDIAGAYNLRGDSHYQTFVIIG